MLIKSDCHVPDGDISLLKEIQSAQTPVELWAYGLCPSKTIGITAFEFAIRQGRSWYEVFQDLEMINDEEYPRMHIVKHSSESASPFSFTLYEHIYQMCSKKKIIPFTPYKSVYQIGPQKKKNSFAPYEVIYEIDPQEKKIPSTPFERIFQTSPKKKEVNWTKVATLHPPFTVSLFRDTFSTCNEQKDGSKLFRHKSADIAFGFESISSGFFLQTIDHPSFLKVCRAADELDDVKELWTYHINEDEEIEQMRAEDIEEYFHCQRLVEFSRTKMNL